MNTYINMGYPPKKLKNVESLRHLYLNRLLKIKNKLQKRIFYNIDSWRLFKKKYFYQLELLNNYQIKIKKINFIFKSHPACDIDLKIFKKFKY